MMAKNILSNLIKAFCYCFRSIFELLKRSITLRNEQQQIEYIYELNFHDHEVDGQKIKKTFQWLDINNRNEFNELKINDKKREDLELFYLEMAAIEQKSEDIKNSIQNGIFLCLGDYREMVDLEMIEYIDDYVMNDQQQIIINNDQLVFERIKIYAIRRFKLDGEQNFKKLHLNKIMGRQIFTFDFDGIFNLDSFQGKQYDIRILQNIIITNNIKPKDISKLEDGESIFEEILRVERLLSSQFKLNPKHLHYVAKRMFIRQPLIQLIEDQINETNNLILHIENLKQNQPFDWQNIKEDLINQINIIKVIAEKYKWTAEITNIKNILTVEVNQDWLDKILVALEKIKLKLQSTRQHQENLPPLITDLKCWAQLFQDLKTKQKFLQIFQNNNKLILHKKEFIDILQQIL